MRDVGAAAGLVAAVAAVATASGWWHVVIALLVGASGLFLMSYARTAGEMIARNAPERSRRRERLIADMIVGIAAASRESPASIDLLEEALSILDEIETEHPIPGRLTREALLFAVRLPKQVPSRSDSSTPLPDPRLEGKSVYISYLSEEFRGEEIRVALEKSNFDRVVSSAKRLHGTAHRFEFSRDFSVDIVPRLRIRWVPRDK